MKKLRNIVLVFILLSILVFLANQYVYADRKTHIRLVKFSDDFKRWTELSSEEKLNSIQPKFYDDLNTNISAKNPMYDASIVGASVNPSFSLMNVIKDNLQIRDQLTTNACWAFSGLSSLETNLALYNYKNNLENKIYDFSEKHANYATTRLFKNNQENMYGYNRDATSGRSVVFN